MVHDREGLLDGEVRHEVEQAVVVEDDEGVRHGLEPMEPGLGVPHPAPLGPEGRRREGDDDAPRGLGELRDVRGDPRARPAPPARPDERQIAPAPPRGPAVMNVKSAPPSSFRSSASAISAHRSPISGRPPAPIPRVTAAPMRSFRSAWIESRWTASVFTTRVRAPWIPRRWSRLTEFPPAPPHPTTRTFGFPRLKESRNVWLPVLRTASSPIPCSHPFAPAVMALPRPFDRGAWGQAPSASPVYRSADSIALCRRRRTYSRTALRIASSTDTESPDFTSCWGSTTFPFGSSIMTLRI